MYFLPFFWWFFSSQLSYKINKGFCKISDCFESYHSQFDGDCAWRKVSNVAFSVFHFVLYFTCLFPKNNSVWNQFHQFYFIFFPVKWIGMDDTFVMLSSWQRNYDPRKSVPMIMRGTYEDAAVSITITSLTNIVAFTIGVAIPSFAAVTNFCSYITIGLTFIYIWTLVFFGACLAMWTRNDR